MKTLIAALLITASGAALAQHSHVHVYHHYNRHITQHHHYNHHYKHYNHASSRDAANLLIGLAVVAGVAAAVNSANQPQPQQVVVQPQVVNMQTTNCRDVPVYQNSKIVSYNRVCD